MNPDQRAVLHTERKTSGGEQKLRNIVASGEFIVFLTDDEWMKDKLLIQTAEPKQIRLLVELQSLVFHLDTVYCLKI